MGCARDVFAGAAIDDQLAYFDLLRFAGICPDIHGTPAAQGNGVGPGGGNAAASQQQNA
jgi:hypothetical protein